MFVTNVYRRSLRETVQKLKKYAKEGTKIFEDSVGKGNFVKLILSLIHEVTVTLLSFYCIRVFHSCSSLRS